MNNIILEKKATTFFLNLKEPPLLMNDYSNVPTT